MDPIDVHMQGWTAGASGAPMAVDRADDEVYRRGYERGAAQRETERDSFLAPGQWLSAQVRALW